MSVSETARRWKTISLDVVEVGTIQTVNYKYILTVMDVFTRDVISVPLRSKKKTDLTHARDTVIGAVRQSHPLLRYLVISWYWRSVLEFVVYFTYVVIKIIFA